MLAFSYRSAIFAFVVVGILSYTVLQLLALLRTPRTPHNYPGSDMAPAESAPRPFTEAELAEYDGTDGASIYIAVKDPWSEQTTVFDMRSSVSFYGPGGPYHVFAGKNATHGLAKSSVDSAQVTGDLELLTEHEKDTHMQWYAKFSSKYPKVGYLVAEPSYKVESNPTESKKDV